MRRELDCAVAIFTDQAVTDATAFDWSRIDRQQVKRAALGYGRPRRLSRHRQSHAFGGPEYCAHSMGTRAGRRQDADRCRERAEREATTAPARRTNVKRGKVRRGARYRSYRRPRCSHARFALRRRPSALGSSCALQLADYDQVSGAITVRHDERQVYATNGGKEAIDAWIASRGDWPGALLCPVAKGGRIKPRGHDHPGREWCGCAPSRSRRASTCLPRTIYA